jgi:hypothetical protein
MPTFNFSLVLGGVTEDTLNVMDALFEAGCNDCLVRHYGKSLFVEFDREAQTLESAILSAIQNIESAGIGAKVTSIDESVFVGLSDIAKLSGLTRQAIALFKDGKRGGDNGYFPVPAHNLSNKQSLWRWSEVAQWLVDNHKIDASLAVHALTIERINLALTMRVSEQNNIVAEFVQVLS